MFINFNGVLKKVGNHPLMRKVAQRYDIYYRLYDIDACLQERLKDMAITPLELRKGQKERKSSVIDQYGNNIFALVLDLPLEKRFQFADQVVTLNEALEFLKVGMVLRKKR